MAYNRSTVEVIRICCCKDVFFLITSIYFNIALNGHIVYDIASTKRALSDYTDNYIIAHRAGFSLWGAWDMKFVGGPSHLFPI